MISTITFFAYTSIGRLMLAAGAVTLAGVFVFYQGVDWQKGRQAKQEVKVLTKTVEVIKQVQVGQESISKAYEKGRSEREEEFRSLQGKFDQQLRALLAALPDACTWPDDVVRVLNDARVDGRNTTDSGEPISPMPTARSAYRWETRVSSPPDVGRRQAIQGMQRQASVAY